MNFSQYMNTLGFLLLVWSVHVGIPKYHLSLSGLVPYEERVQLEWKLTMIISSKKFSQIICNSWCFITSVATETIPYLYAFMLPTFKWLRSKRKTSEWRRKFFQVPLYFSRKKDFKKIPKQSVAGKNPVFFSSETRS